VISATPLLRDEGRVDHAAESSAGVIRSLLDVTASCTVPSCCRVSNGKTNSAP